MNPLFKYRILPWKVYNSGVVNTGQVLLRMEWGRGARLDLYNGGSSDLPAYLIFDILKIVLGVGWVGKFERLHQDRRNMWKVEVYLNPIETKVYRLYKASRNKTVCSSMITVCSGMIRAFSIRMEDAAALLKRIIEDYPPDLMPCLRSNRYNYFLPAHFPCNAEYKPFAEVPEPIKRSRWETKRIKVAKECFLTGVRQAGESSGIIETIEALKSLEVLMA